MKVRQLFGTDGVRGVAGEFPLDPKTVYALGAALGDIASRMAPSPEIVIGMDTRESSPWIAGHVAGGLRKRGAAVRFAGVTTTPGVAYLTRTNSFVAGVMISASHNPYRDNGIKIFGHSGYKLPDEQEHAVEQEIFALLEAGVEPQPVELTPDAGLGQHYIDYLASTLGRSLSGLKLVVDCGNGAASALAPKLFERLGARVTAIECSPDGRNINLGCGALHIEKLQKTVLDCRADVGVAFDGDADRAILVSRSGKVVDGDAVLLMCAKALHAKGRLTGPDGQPAVVATVMSNLGLERALAARGIKLLRTPVGDKYVLEEMLRTGAVLGGEQSGHIIFSEYATTGDGLLTALRVIDTVLEAGSDLDELTSELEVYPQRLVNVRIKSKKPLSELPAVNEEIRAAERDFGSAGRVLVRFSGTEPLARVMVEGPDLARVEAAATRIAAAIERDLG
ncbi:MAG TPA: phosphoglucosamine mutase [Bryobacteraceae bacterium]|nr:phosphoglucosamine mutase [Bryobacteraceae bacterium]HOQ46258.1 phosphoglucosamine mutase [Bryobacteraceae bacterium]HPQ15161.1 phosphoglucosamine mutase [Bryobacteraceae bacterium]HPU74247.1 phosphoglucosamine mutase [Bryobacteraceae bacterium]